jgi:hypothetical protein
MTAALIKRDNLMNDTYIGRLPCKDEGRNWLMYLQAKECQRLPKDHQKLEEKQGPDSFSQS